MARRTTRRADEGRYEVGDRSFREEGAALSFAITVTERERTTSYVRVTGNTAAIFRVEAMEDGSTTIHDLRERAR